MARSTIFKPILLVSIAICLMVVARLGYAWVQPPVVSQQAVVYRQVDDQELHFDFARPEGVGPFPCVVCIHGGGWQKGNYRDMRPVIQLLAQNGFAAATVEYRLAPKHHFPAPVEDCKAAVRYFRSHASKYHIDGERIGVVGASAGGHLATMLGLTDEKDGFNSATDKTEVSSDVQAVINFYGAMDFEKWQLTPVGELACRVGFDGKDLNGVIKDFLGTADRQAPVMQRATAASYADSNDPPVLTFQGTLDVLVPVEEARRFHQALLDADVRSTLVEVPNANHGFGGAAMQKAAKQSLEFLNQHLK